ncbi:MAG: hypothetical protein ACNS63_10725 [Candidatus Nitrospinota bacterium M3_3B_026]
MRNSEAALKLLKEHKKLYQELLGRAKEMNERLGEGADPAVLLSLMAERDKTLEKIRENDARIEKLAAEGKESASPEEGEAESLLKDIRGIVMEIMEIDEEGRRALEAESGAVRGQFSDIARTKKSLAGYGSRSKKDIYGKYKDLKL